MFGVVISMIIYEVMSCLNRKNLAGGVVVLVNCWVIGLAMYYLVTMGHMKPPNGETDTGDDGRRALMAGDTAMQLDKVAYDDDFVERITQAHSASEVEFILSLFMVGISSGGMMFIVPVLVDEYFGMKSFGV